MTQLFAYVNDASLQAGADGTSIGVQATKRGEVRIQDFYTHMALQGRVFQIRAGAVATGVAMASTITATAAEAAVDAAAGTTIIPAAFDIAFDDITNATTVRVNLLANVVASSAGTAFTPLNMLQGGSASVSTARVANNGGVTVTTDAATTTRVLFRYNNVATETPVSVSAQDGVAGAGPLATIASLAWNPRVPYVGKGVSCVYVQCGATTAFPLYFFGLSYVELPSANL